MNLKKVKKQRIKWETWEELRKKSFEAEEQRISRQRTNESNIIGEK
jgi:acyl-CoA-binding protein